MKSKFLGLLVLAVVMLAGGVAAQTGPTSSSGDQPALFVSGTIISSTGSSMLIKTTSGEELTFSIDSRSALPADLPVGTEVDVKYHALPDGQLHAAEVRRLDAAGGSPSSAQESGLPQTASPLAMTALLGIVALVAASGAWLLARRHA